MPSFDPTAIVFPCCFALDLKRRTCQGFKTPITAARASHLLVRLVLYRCECWAVDKERLNGTGFCLSRALPLVSQALHQSFTLSHSFSMLGQPSSQNGAVTLWPRRHKTPPPEVMLTPLYNPYDRQVSPSPQWACRDTVSGLPPVPSLTT
jgi:hypothetical protein